MRFVCRGLRLIDIGVQESWNMTQDNYGLNTNETENNRLVSTKASAVAMRWMPLYEAECLN